MSEQNSHCLETALGHVPEATEDYVLSRSLKGKLGQLVPYLLREAK